MPREIIVGALYFRQAPYTSVKDRAVYYIAGKDKYPSSYIYENLSTGGSSTIHNRSSGASWLTYIGMYKTIEEAKQGSPELFI